MNLLSENCENVNYCMYRALYALSDKDRWMTVKLCLPN